MKLNSLLKRYIKRFSLSNIKPKTVYLGIFILLACFLIFKFFIKPNLVEGFFTDEDIESRLKMSLLVSNEDFLNGLIQIHKNPIESVKEFINKSLQKETFFIGTGDKNKDVTTTFFDILFKDYSYYKEFITEFPDRKNFMDKMLPLLNDIPELNYKDLNEEEKQLINTRLDFIWSNFKNMNDVKEKYNNEINKIIKTISNSLKTQESAGGIITINSTSTYAIKIKDILNQLLVELKRHNNNNLKIRFLLENQHYINFAEVEKRKNLPKTPPVTTVTSGSTTIGMTPPTVSNAISTTTPLNSFDNDIIGDYEINPSISLTDNDYNHVTITKSSEGIFKWTIRGGLVSWSLSKDGTNTNYLIVGNDCPYYNSGYTKATIFRPTSANNAVGIEGPNNIIYYKKK